MLLASLNGETFDKIMVQAKPKNLEDLELNEMEQMLTSLLELVSGQSDSIFIRYPNNKVKHYLTIYRS